MFIDPSIAFQTIEGFGGAFTEAGAVTLRKMSKRKPEADHGCLLRAASGGHGYSVCRTHINSCDFSTGNYAYDETPGDTELKHFSIDRAIKARCCCR